jgi:hypothetical protein
LVRSQIVARDDRIRRSIELTRACSIRVTARELETAALPLVAVEGAGVVALGSWQSDMHLTCRKLAHRLRAQDAERELRYHLGRWHTRLGLHARNAVRHLPAANLGANEGIGLALFGDLAKQRLLDGIASPARSLNRQALCRVGFLLRPHGAPVAAFPRRTPAQHAPHA